MKMKMKMKRRLLGLLLVVSLLVSVASGCSSGNQAAPRDESYGSTAKGRSASMSTSAPEATRAESVADDGAAYDTGDSLAGIGSLSGDITNPILSERKIIRSANLDIEIENFDTAFSNVETIILGIGFIQETNINTDRVYVDDEMKLIKSGTIVIRVDSSKFDTVLNKLRGIGNVFNYTTHGEDVTDQYFDVESRLRLLRLEQEKLEAYLAKLNNLDEIFKAESRLTDIRYQIESLTGTLKKLSSLVELSTITVYLHEKRPGSDVKPLTLTYGERLLNELKESLLNVVKFLGDLLLFMVAALPALILLGVLVLIGVSIYKRATRNRKPEAGGVGSAAVLPGQETPPAGKGPDAAEAGQADGPETK
jgi:hypothetical protein